MSAPLLPITIDMNDFEISQVVRENAITELISTLEHLYSETSNSLYVWEAIAYCKQFDREMPGWAVTQIHNVAEAIHNLIASASTWQFSSKALQPFKASLDFKEAEKRAKEAMGFSQGKNAFQRLALDRIYIEEATALHGADMREEAGAGQALPRTKVKARIRAKRNLDNDRVVEKRAKRGVSLRPDIFRT